MRYRSIHLLKHLKANRRDCRDLADVLTKLDPNCPDFDVEVDLFAAALCQGKELPGHFGDCALMDARLLISGVVGACACCPSDGVLDLRTVRGLIAGPGLCGFARSAMKFGPYVRARLAAYALPDSATNKTLQAIRGTATALLNAHIPPLRLKKHTEVTNSL